MFLRKVSFSLVVTSFDQLTTKNQSIDSILLYYTYYLQNLNINDIFMKILLTNYIKNVKIKKVKFVIYFNIPPF